MKTINKTFNVYTYDELSDGAKYKACEDYRMKEHYYPFLEDNMNERLYELLQEYHMQDVGTGKERTTYCYYDLSYSQGSGAMFYGTVTWKGNTVNIKHDGRYYHSNSKTFTILNDDGEEPENYNDVEVMFDAEYKALCKELENYGYSELEYQDSEEYIRQDFEANEFLFLEDGTVYTE